MFLFYAGLLHFIFFNSVYDQPFPRHLEEITYDKNKNKLLLFGGVELNGNSWMEPSILYERDGNSWKKINAQGPVGRRGHGWIYDEGRRETILIGGACRGKTVEDSLLFDVWHWSGAKWRQVNTNCPVKEPEAVYDPINKGILVYGDANDKTSLENESKAAFELWEYKKEGWKKLSGNGPDIGGSRMMAYDSERKRLVVPVFDEKGVAIWEWDGQEWSKNLFEKDCPHYRTRFAFAYDPVKKILVLFGGLSEDRKQLGDFWSWDGKQWKQIESVNTPSARNSAHFAAGNGVLFLYGGSVPKATQPGSLELSNELWRWKNDLWEKIN